MKKIKLLTPLITITMLTGATTSVVSCSTPTTPQPVVDNTLSVSFDLDGGTIVGLSSDNSMKVVDGYKIGQLPKPKKPGYIFDKWLYKNNPISESTEIKQDIKLKATYVLMPLPEEKVTVVLHLNGGRIDDQEDEYVIDNWISGNTIKQLPTPTKMDANFDCWMDQKGWRIIGDIPITNNVELFASYIGKPASDPLCFKDVPNDGKSTTISYAIQSFLPNIDIEISKDGIQWQDWDGDEIELGDTGDYIYVRNTQSTLSNSSNFFYFVTIYWLRFYITL